MRSGVLAAVAAGLTMVFAVTSCSGVKKLPAPGPITIPTTTTSTTTPDYSTATLPGIAGATTVPTIAIQPGGATLSGSVVDNTGSAVSGATVELDRVVGSAVATGDVTTTAAGTWLAQNIQGGVYRVRAWLAPSLAMSAPQEVYLGATVTQSLNLTLASYVGYQVVTSIAPDPPLVDVLDDLAVQVTTSTVTPTGIVTAVGAPSVAVDLIGTNGWQVQGASQQLTSAGGDTYWQVYCGTLGADQMTVILNNSDELPLTLPACAPLPTTTLAPTTTVAATTTVP